ncbi:MAG: hypothetical protein NWF04_04895 [Candidatus Bathyarchaeota archaeon]|nr:hypothetical protein [Candidatus Bathyarchaeota archaeon]
MAWHERREQKGFAERVITAVAVGGSLIILGIVIAANPGVFGNLWDFLGDLGIVQVWGSWLYLPAPESPWMHTSLYSAVWSLSLGVSILQAVLLVARVAFHSRTSKISETVGNLVFWGGQTYLITVFLNLQTTRALWFEFWAAMIIVIGVSFIARGLVYLAKQKL